MPRHRLLDIRTGLRVSETLKHQKRVGSLQYSSDGQRILTASVDGTERIWGVPHWPVPAPAWLPRLAEAVGGRRIISLRQLEVVPVVELRELQQQLQQSPANDPYSRWAQWSFADRSTRSLAPESAISVIEHVQLCSTRTPRPVCGRRWFFHPRTAWLSPAWPRCCERRTPTPPPPALPKPTGASGGPRNCRCTQRPADAPRPQRLRCGGSPRQLDRAWIWATAADAERPRAGTSHRRKIFCNLWPISLQKVVAHELS